MATHSSILPGESQGQRSLCAAVYGVAQSQIRLKRLSSSSSRGTRNLASPAQPGFQPSSPVGLREVSALHSKKELLAETYPHPQPYRGT